MIRPITELKNEQCGKDIYVLGAGRSMDWIPTDFFKDKITVGVNDVWVKYKCDYLVRKDFDFGRKQPLVDYLNSDGADVKFITAEHDCGNHGKQKCIFDLNHDYWMFQHVHNDDHAIDLNVVGTDKIFVCWSTITSAIHVAYYLGAKNIIICGHDLKETGGECYMKEYLALQEPMNKDTRIWEGITYQEWFGVIKPQSKALCDRIRSLGCGVYFLNPQEVVL